MPLNRRRLLEFAAERLEAERLRIDEELAEVKAELGSEKSTPKTKTKTPTRKRRSMKLSAKEHKARSDRMKKYWADRKEKEKQKAKRK